MTATQRIAACIEYCGRNYSGWQYQDNAPSVQQCVEASFSKVANESLRVVAAGRTDTGVHGIGQVIHFDTTSRRQPHEWLRGVNTHLPDDITLIWTRQVAPDFHARFSALERRYRYVILNRPTSPSYLHGLVTWHYAPLEVEPMIESAQVLVGRHDFSAFRAAGCQARNPQREIRRLEIHRNGPWIWIDIDADGFLHHMVRNIAGTLMRVGERLEPVQWVGDVLAAGDRKIAGMTAPPDGLYFCAVDYDSRFELPPPPAPCRFW